MTSASLWRYHNDALLGLTVAALGVVALRSARQARHRTRQSTQASWARSSAQTKARPEHMGGGASSFFVGRAARPRRPVSTPAPPEQPPGLVASTPAAVQRRAGALPRTPAPPEQPPGLVASTPAAVQRRAGALPATRMVAAGERSRAQPLGAELRALVRREARVQLTRLRTWLALGFAAAVPALITMAFAVGGPANATQGSPSANFLAVATRSGLDMPLASLDAMAPFLLVVLAAVFLGEPLAAEASWGNLRALLARPVRRGSLLAAKAVVGTALFVVSVVAAALSALATGVAAFGWHAVVTPEQTVFSPGVAAVRVAIAVGYTVLALASTGAVALFASTVTDSTIGSVATAIGFAVVSEVLDAIPTLGHVRGALPTHELLAWGNLFLVPAQLRPMGEGLLEQLPYVIAASLAAWRWFVSKDVLS